MGPSRIDGRQWIYSAYIQDDFRILPKLTLNFGLRYELAPPVYDVASADVEHRLQQRSLAAEHFRLRKDRLL